MLTLPIQKIRNTLPGITVCFIVALAALFLNGHYGAPTMLFALLLGLAIGFLDDSPKMKAGVQFTAKTLLRVGVALLGLRIAISDIIALGLHPIILIIAAVASTILFGWLAARLMGFRGQFGILTGGAVAICGASAAMALSSVLPKDDKSDIDTIFAVVGVTTLSTLAMILYPVLTNYLQYNDLQAGLFVGGTIHDVAQVIGAGFSVSEETGNISTLTKMMRVALLVPVVIMVALIFKSKATASQTHASAGQSPTFPFFLIMFIVFVLVNSGLQSLDLESIAVQTLFVLKTGLIQLSKFCLVIAIVAIGIKTKLQDIVNLGIKPVLLMVAQTIWIAAVFVLAIPFIS